MSPSGSSCVAAQVGAHSMDALSRSVRPKSCSCLESSSPPPLFPQSTQSERSLAFKRWARGRCYRCLAHDHQVRFCKNAFRCIRCRLPGYSEKFCCFRSPSPGQRVHSVQQQHVEPPQIPGPTQNWVHVVGKSSLQEHHSKLLKSQSNPIQEKDKSLGCGRSCCSWAPHSSSCLDPKAVMAPLLESLRSELDQLVVARLEEVMRPIREELSTVKLWLARVTNFLECAKPDGEHWSASNMAELFGPCSPVRHSPSPMILASFAEECALAETHGEASTSSEEMTTGSCATKILQELPMDQSFEMTTRTITSQVVVNPSKEQKPLQAVDEMKVVAIVEDTSDVEPISYVESTSLEQLAEQLMVPPSAPLSNQVNSVVTDSIVEHWVDTRSLSHHRRTKIKYLKPVVKVVRDMLTKKWVFVKRDIQLSDVGKNGKLDEGKLQKYAYRLKDLLPPHLLMALMAFKARAFWDIVTALSPQLD